MAFVENTLPSGQATQVAPLFKEEFPYEGSQTFVTTNPYSQVYSVEVHGVGALSESQYTLDPPNTIIINDTLENGSSNPDFIVIIYGQASTATLPYYTQAQTDALLDGKEDPDNKQNNLNFDGTAIKYPTVDTVNVALLRNTKLFGRTGISNKNDNFELEVFDINTVRIKSVDNALFWNELFLTNAVSDDAFKSFPEIIYPLTELVTGTGGNVNTVPLTVDGLYVRYIGYNKDGYVYSKPDNFIEDSGIVQLGFVTVVKTGAVVSFLGGITPGGRNVFSRPILANLNDLDRTTVQNTTDVRLEFNIGTPTLKSNSGSITGVSINWKGIYNPGNSSPIDKFNYTGDDFLDFLSVDPNFYSETTPPVLHVQWTEFEDGFQINRSFYNTLTSLRDELDINTFSLKRVLIGVRGGIFLQEAEHEFSTAYISMEVAKSNLYTHKFSDVINPSDVSIEIARIAFKKGVTDFSDPDQFSLVATIGGSSSGGGTVSVGDATTTSKGIVQLAGDLSGTAINPTVPDLINKLEKRSFINIQSTISYTLQLVDSNVRTDIVFTNINPVTVTVPTNSSIPIPIGTEIQCTVQGNGRVTVIGPGVTFLAKNFNFTTGDTFVFTKLATDIWSIDGGFTPVSIDYIIVPTTSYTLLTTDNGKQIITTHGSTTTVTIPSGLPIGFNCEVLQQGIGQIVFTGSGTTLRINSFEIASTVERYSLVGIDNIPNVTEEYHLFGGLTSI